MLNIRYNMFETNSSNVNALTYHNVKGYIDNITAKISIEFYDIDNTYDDDELKQELNDIFHLEDIDCELEGSVLEFTGTDNSIADVNFFVKEAHDTDMSMGDELDKQIFNQIDYDIVLSDDKLEKIRLALDKNCSCDSEITIQVNAKFTGHRVCTGGYMVSTTVQAWGDPSRGVGRSETYDLDDIDGKATIKKLICTKKLNTKRSVSEVREEEREAALKESAFRDNIASQLKIGLSSDDIEKFDFDESADTTIDIKLGSAEIKVSYRIERRSPRSPRQSSTWEKGGYKYFDIYANILTNETRRNIEDGYIAEIHRVPKYDKWKSGNIEEKMNKDTAYLLEKIIIEHLCDNLGISDKMK